MWDPLQRFVKDVMQRRGNLPGRWVHTAPGSEETNGGTTVGDVVEFDVPFSFAAGWFVMRDVRKIFAFQGRTLLERFGALLLC